MPQGDPRPGEKYLHFKNKLYQVTAIAQHSETGEKMVVYQALYGTFQTYVRPFGMFVSPVDKEKCPQVKQKYRFQWVEFRKTDTMPSRHEEPKKMGISGQEKPMKKPMEENAASQEKEVKEPVKEDAAGQENPARVEVRTKEPRKKMSAEDKMMAFFDADTAEEKYQVLLDMHGEVTDRMINNMAVVLDVIIEEGPLDLRYEELKSCLRTMQRYDSSRFR